MLMSSVSVSNCIKFYQTAEDIGAKDLQKYCAEIISNHWVGEVLMTYRFSSAMSTTHIHEVVRQVFCLNIHERSCPFEVYYES